MKRKMTLFTSLFMASVLFLTMPFVTKYTSASVPDVTNLVIATSDNGPVTIERLLYLALNDIGLNVDFIYPIVREGYIQANEGTCDGVIAGYPDLQTTYTNLIKVPVPLERIHVRVFATEGSNISVNNWNELDGKRVGILEHRTYIPGRLPDSAITTAKPTNRAVLNGLVNGEYDVAVLAEREHETLGDRLGITRIGQVDQLTEYLYLNNKHESLVPEIAVSLENMFHDGRAGLILNNQHLPEINQRRTIIHIISTSIEIQREDQFNAALRSKFEDDMSIEWMTINIDSQRFARGERNLAYIAALLRADSVSRNVAAIIVSGEPALEFLKDYYSMFFRNVPVLFYGVSEHYHFIINDSEHNFTGIVKNIEAYETVSAALNIFPGTQNLFVVNGHTEKGFLYKREIEADLKPLENRLNITYNKDLNIEELLAQISALPKDSLLFVGSYFVDADNQYFSQGEMRRLLERSCSVPILSVFSTNLEYHALGGKSLDYERYGFVIADMLKSLLDGGNAEDIPVIHDSTGFNRWVFDYNLMNTFNVRPRDLPAGAEIINSPPTVWESNPQSLTAMITVFVISALLIIGVSIFSTISYRHNKQKSRLQKELAIERNAAQAASKAKSNFLTNMSHEMRTPLTAVLGLTEMILESSYLSDETHSNLVKVYKSGETLLYLVNDILDLSKIEAGKLELNMFKYDVPSLLNDAITQSINYIKGKPVKLVLDINETLPNYLFGDELRVKQILNNLLSNAFKFTKEGTVEFGMRCNWEIDTVWLTIWIRDTGIGIREQDLGKLFTLYGKMEEDHKTIDADRRTEGTGLGLYITKKIVETLGGTISVESEYGKGSTFTVKIPQNFVSSARIDSKVIENLKSFKYTYREAGDAKTERLNLSYARVLVVDDNPINLDVVKGLLNLYRIRADVVTSGKKAVDLIRNEVVRYDAIFMDHMMPGMDGIETTRRIREEIGTRYAKTIPVIAVTANAIEGNEELFLSKGFQVFISKPIDLARFDSILRKWLRDKKKEALLPEKTINIESRREVRRDILREDIPGLDINKGIMHYGYSEEAYIHVLRSFVKYSQNLLNAIKDLNYDDLSEYKTTIHGIKGSCFGIFAEAIGNEAGALEMAALKDDHEYIKSNNKKFIDNVQNLLSDIERSISKDKTALSGKPSKDKPDKVLLSNLLKACESFDIDEIDNAIDEIEAYDYYSDNGLTGWLCENINQGKYKAVITRLQKLV